MRVGDYLLAPRPAWDFQTMDCSRWIAAWIVARGRRNPMTAIGVRYSTRIGAARVIRAGGGLLDLWTKGMAAIGCLVIEAPGEGDVAVLSVKTDDDTDQGCGIWTGRRWATVQPQGLMFGAGEPLRIWRV